MELLTTALLVLIIVLIIMYKGSVEKGMDSLEAQLRELNNLLRQQQHARPAPPKSLPTIMEEEEAVPIFVKPPTEIKREDPKPEPPRPEIPKPESPRPAPPVVVERQKEVIEDSLSSIRKPVRQWEPAPRPQPEEPQPTFFERNPDLEKFIGENLVNKIGIAVLVLAIAFFVKYAIDNNWIGPVGRVGIGVLCGAILIGFAHRMRNSYKAFSSVLVGGGLAILYFTITLAYQDFHLFSQTISFAILIVITIFAVTLALLYDRQEVAVIALVGGFASPFMVSNGSNNYIALFTYLLLLNIGLLIIAYYKAWRVLNITAFVFTVAVFGAALTTLTAASYHIGFWYSMAFYLLFFVINIINNVRENKKFLAADFTILLANTALYFAAGLYLLTEMGVPQYRGLFSAGLGVINLGLSFILFRNRKVDTNILYLLIGITLTFVSVTGPVQLHGHYITIFWASETVLLYWLYQKSDIQLMKLTSLVVWMLMMISLVMDVLSVYGEYNTTLTIIANKGFITTVFSAISSYLLYLLVKRDPNPQIFGMGIVANLYRVVALVLLFLSGVFEINQQFSTAYPDSGLSILYLMLYVPVFISLLCFISSKIRSGAFNAAIAMALLACCVGVYLAFIPSLFDVLNDILEKHRVSAAHFTAHWIGALFIGVIFYQLIRLCRDNFEESMQATAAWILFAAIVLFLSLEFCMASELLFYSKTNSIDKIQTVYIKTALPVLWGVSSFILMWIGMNRKQRVLRIISLTLFTITLVKLFMFDINNIPVAGKIAAFFCLGVLLLIISFMYQKVKKIIADDDEKPKDDK